VSRNLVPIIYELEPPDLPGIKPCWAWTVDITDGTPARKVTVIPPARFKIDVAFQGTLCKVQSSGCAPYALLLL
jgi:hypothetical protein